VSTPGIVVVTPNPAVDVTYRVARQQIGVTQRVHDVRRMPGGKGLNVARVLAALDTPSLSLLPLGGMAGTWIARELDERRMPARIIPVTGDTRTTVTVVDDAAHPTMFGEPGPSLSDAEWAAVTAAIAETISAEAADATAMLLVISGSLPPGTDPALVGGWVEAATRRGVMSIVDCSGAALLTAAAARASVLKPNRQELREATGVDDEHEAARELLGLGAGAVVVSRGADGVAVHTHRESVALPAVPGVSGNPTGAGDAAVAGLALALANGTGLDDALRHACALGAAAVLRLVAGEVDVAAYRRFLSALPTPSKERS
jgi:tagatose 6-phosphate kinase